MASETTIRLPARLVSVIRTDGGAPAPIAVPAGPPACGTTPTTTGAPAAPDPEARDRAEAEAVLAKLLRAAQSYEAKERHTLETIKRASIELAMSVAGHFLTERVQRGDYPFEKVIGRALEQLAPRQPVTILLNPEDLALLQRRLGETLLPAAQDARWSADAALPRGVFRVETMDRGVLFDLGNRLDVLRQTLLQTAQDHGV